MKRLRGLLAVSIACCLAILALAWWAVSAIAERKTRELLSNARANFSQTCERSLDGFMWYVGALAAERLGYATGPHALETMVALAEELYVDEINVSDTNGITTASNFASHLGYDYRASPETMPYFRLFDPKSRLLHITQPFRASSLEDTYYKYVGVAFTNRQGFVQVGYSMRRLLETMAFSDPESIGRWTFGRFGRFGAVDLDQDRQPDPAPASLSESVGLFERLKTAEGRIDRLTFSFAGHLFFAEVPDREFGEMRNIGFLLASALILVLAAIFISMLVRLRLSALRMEVLHRKAQKATEAEMQIACRIQNSSRPRIDLFRPADMTFSIDDVCETAREVGGDFYDFFEMPDGRIAVCICDVSGKGVPAAMFMLLVKKAVAIWLQMKGELSDVVACINDELCGENEAELFATFWIGALDLETGDLEYVNAGHNRPYLVRASGVVEQLTARGGRLLGLFPKLAYSSTHVRLSPGDRLFVYTDGVTEAMDAARKTYGEKRLEKVLLCGPRDLCAAVRSDVAVFTAGAPLSDDLTALTLAWHGSAPALRREFDVSLESLGRTLDFLRDAVVLEADRPKRRLLNAADEMISNIVGYSGARHITVEVCNVFGRTRVVLTDDGRAYNPLSRPDPDVHVSLEARPIGGLGIFMAKHLVDAIFYRRENDRNVLTLVQFASDRRCGYVGA